MADARALLRQQRAARRIDHPQALYTDAGKLSCTACHEIVRSDAQWDSHVRSLSHRQRVLAQQKTARGGVHNNSTTPAAAGATSSPLAERKAKPSKETLSDEALLAQIIGGTAAGQKRKHGKQDEDHDVTMADAAEEHDDGNTTPGGHDRPASEYDDDNGDASDSRLHKRSKPSSDSGTVPPSRSTANGRPAAGGVTGSPPDLVRRSSGTPSHGIELQIPSRPATPSASATSTSSTPKATASVGRSPLTLEGGNVGEGSSKQVPRAAFATTTTITNDGTAAPTPASNPLSSPTTTTAGKGGAPPLASHTDQNDENDDDEWAAFEAEVVNATAIAPNTTTSAIATINDAVITAQPMTAEQIAAQKAQEEQQAKRARADMEIEDDKEEATRALETEFEEMEELEARVRRLREKREALRRGSVAGVGAAGTGTTGGVDGVAAGIVTETENKVAEEANSVAAAPSQDDAAAVKDEQDEDDDDDDDDDDDEDDDWAGFRFRA
ncbi:hypothetical protein BD289DRAFT_424754 [Coniella lustricola]|uniref:Coiled-coil domain-containing protein 16 n=1 Tax=Coniella lustricola TaxID=2025994 RepID=A0A2T3AIA3_9PEZI|nr:hypothetical protein BD289DRAFT_424754 [Coniella lustricola]